PLDRGGRAALERRQRPRDEPEADDARDGTRDRRRLALGRGAGRGRAREHREAGRIVIAADWVTISALATAAGTLVLAMATFASVRSANRAARVAERSLLAGLRPLLMPSRLEDTPQKVNFVDGKELVAPGGGAVADY